MKAFVFTDPHGSLEEMKELLSGIDRDKTRVFCAGDLIDRGRDTEGVIGLGQCIHAITLFTTAYWLLQG